MGLRALSLLLLLLLQSVWTAAAQAHLCAGEVRTAHTCGCKRAQDDSGATVKATRASCCESPLLQAAPELLVRASDGDAARTIAATPRPPIESVRVPSSPQSVVERRVARRARERVGRLATAPPLFLRHCSFLI